MWAKEPRCGTVYRVNNVALLAVKMGDLEGLSTESANRKFTLPDNLDVNMQWTHQGTKKSMTEASRLSSIPVLEVADEYDTVFMVRSKRPEAFLKTCYDPDNGPDCDARVSFTPHFNSFTR